MSGTTFEMFLESSFTELATVYLELQIKPQGSFNLASEKKQLNKTLASLLINGHPAYGL